MAFQFRTFFAGIIFLGLISPAGFAQNKTQEDEITQAGDQLLNSFFASETERVTRTCLSEIQSLKDWNSNRDIYHLQLREMLGLSPWPERTPLKPVVTGTLSREGVIVENIHFQSLPGLYVTGNLYRPEKQSGPLPAILYVCGHGGVKKNGISYGNKTHYQHHGAWFAQNGYVCLIIDTIQLGELEGIHHGTYSKSMWWWHNRGYTPAGVEAWNGIRSLDYLQSREEVDGERIGMTGRSGGGAYTWWVAALDDRVKAAVPVAGITSMEDHIVDGCIEGHCDCMYMVNTYGWDFPLLAALVAPRPLLISNTDKDRIFPLDGVVDVYFKTRRIYELHNALDNIGLNIAEGPHKDTQELRVNAFHWMNRFLKNDDPLVETTATKLFTPEELKVFKELPTGERTTTIQESFVPEATTTLPQSQKELGTLQNTVVNQLRQLSFRNTTAIKSKKRPDQHGAGSWENKTSRLSVFKYRSDSVYSLPIFLLEPDGANVSAPLNVIVCNQEQWNDFGADLAVGFPDCAMLPKTDESVWTKTATYQRFVKGNDAPTAFLLPRGVGPTTWSGNDRKQVQIKRRFALLGHTLDSLRIHDVIQGVESLHSNDRAFKTIHLEGENDAADWALFAALLGPKVTKVELHGLTCEFRDGPQLLQVSQFVSKPTAVLLASKRVDSLTVYPNKEAQVKCWEELQARARKMEWDKQRFFFSNGSSK